MKQAQQMQEQVQRMQDEATAETAQSSVGGGLVKVTANGAGEVLAIEISPDAIDPDDPEALGDLGKNIASAAYWHKAFPYKSTLTGVSGTELADGYEAASGKQWTQQLGATMSLLDAGFAALKASSDATKPMRRMLVSRSSFEKPSPFDRCSRTSSPSSSST